MTKCFFGSLFVLLLSPLAFAGQPKATICGDVAIEAATALFKINNPEVGPFQIRDISLIEMNHDEGGTELWDISFSKNGLNYSAYRIRVAIDACQVLSFSMPKAN